MKKKSPRPNNMVKVATTTPVLRDRVINLNEVKPIVMEGSKVWPHYNGPTKQLSGTNAGMCVLDPGASPHPPHRHPEEEFLYVADGTGVMVCGRKKVKVGRGSLLYVNGNSLHGITNTGRKPMTFFWSKWLAKGF